MSSDLS
jgi:hypothetical protein